MEWIGLVTAATFRSPGGALERDLTSGRLQEALAELARESGVLPPELPVAPLTELQAAYTRLFVANPGGLPAPPYAGYALDGRLMGEAQEALQAFYAEHGLAVDESWKELPDHLAAVGEAIALLSGQDPQAARSLAFGYLLPWLERYADVVAAEDPTGFYGAICQTLKQVLEAEHEANP
ncbi:TorD/DmsD family molecular chaperone [Oceanithermus sp.]